jgi:GT2 family glycosyltransferase
MPRLTVCVPTYNAAPYLGAALASIRQQTFEDFELIVSDDCSQDETREIAISSEDPRLRFIHNQTRLGLVGNWNRCLELASGSYVSIFHQDDLMQPTTLERMISTLDKYPNVGFVFSDMALIDDDGNVIGGHWNPILPDSDTVFNGAEFFRLLLSSGNLVPCSSVMMRASLLRQWGFFDARLRYTPDLEMWLRLSLHHDVAYLAEPLVSLRRHSGQESTRFIGTTCEIEEVWKAFRIILLEHAQYVDEPHKALGLASSHLRTWTSSFLRQSLRRGDLRLALQFLRQLVRFVWLEHAGLASLS